MSIELLRKPGVYVAPDFLADDLCGAICAEIPHEVTPVADDKRYAAASRFLDPNA